MSGDNHVIISLCRTLSWRYRRKHKLPKNSFSPSRIAFIASLFFPKKFLISGVLSNPLFQMTGGFMRFSVLLPPKFHRSLWVKEARTARSYRNQKTKKNTFKFNLVLLCSVFLSRTSWTSLPEISASSVYHVGQLKTRTQSCPRSLDHVLLLN